MEIVKPSVHLLHEINGEEILARIERAGRVCYKSEDSIASGTSHQFVTALIRRGHESVLEHEKISMVLLCDRGVTHELVRHRIASYSQESTRYCNYSKDKFGNSLTFVKPVFFEEGTETYALWEKSMQEIETSYFALLENGATPEQARTVLTNSLKTEIAVTMNIRSLRNFLKLRTDKAAHPQMRETANQVLDLVKSKIPILFDDIMQ